MEITNQLVKPLLERLSNEYEGLYKELGSSSVKGASELKSYVEGKLGQLESVETDARFNRNVANHMKLRDRLRKMKLELRTAQRRWQRQRLGELRHKKMSGKPDNYVSTVAA